jgi:hypothetical protein
VRRGLQALSSLYVERRDRMAGGSALEGAGKRAAFALYYGPQHFLLVRHVVRALGAGAPAPARILDLGCGTGVAGAAWALEAQGRPAVEGVDQSGWAAEEARWMFGRLGLRGSARRGDLEPAVRSLDRRTAVVLAFTANELSVDARARLWPLLLGAERLLVVEPLSRRVAPWWTTWRDAVLKSGGREDEWRFPAELPEGAEKLGRAAGLDPREMTGRSLYLRKARRGQETAGSAEVRNGRS